ncbi:1-aminocyclopropane-1-carboxylate synthase [Trifolium repens]|nr:1-aminocyclopropane-1-carboxylate synthase [Trifolium repens]
MINYMEKMGKRSPFLTGKYKRLSLRDWDVKTANQELQKIHDIMGLENGLTAGVTRLDNGLTAGLTSLNQTAEGPLVLCFDADTCPLSKMYLTHCRSCINIYTRTAETLERRIAEANVGTSGKDDAVPEEINTNKVNPMEGQAETEKNKSSTNEIVPETERLNNDDDVGKRKESSIPQTSTQAGERYCI